MLIDKFRHEMSKLTAEEMYRSMQRAVKDKEKKFRMETPTCPYCYYLRSMLAGSGFTPFTCTNCNKSFQHSNTNVPKLCRACAKELWVCVHCAGELFSMKDIVKSWKQYGKK